jgi:integrase
MRTKGSVKERWPGKWVVRLYVGKNANGKRVYYHYTVDGTERDARRQLSALVKQHGETGAAVPLSRQSFGEWATEYVDVWGRDLAPRTRSDLRYAFSHYVPVALQATKLTAVTPATLQAWVNGLSAKGLAPRTVAKALAEVRRCLSVATEHGKIPRNPAEYVKPPKRAHVERARLTAEQVNAFTEAAAKDPLYALFVLALFVGPRPAEVLALKWGDLVGDQLTIRRSVVRGAHGKHEVADTKTGKSRRITLGDFERATLARHRAELAERVGLHAVTADSVMFPSETGGTLEIRNVDTRHFKKVLVAAGLPPMRLYDLRHSALSLLADAGVDPKIIQERAGHSSIKTTYDNYIHPRPEGQVLAAAAMNRLVGRGKA